MRGNDFLEKMSLVDPAFVEDADAREPVKKSGWIKWCSIAACFCLIAIGAIAFLNPGAPNQPFGEYPPAITGGLRDNPSVSPPVDSTNEPASVRGEKLSIFENSPIIDDAFMKKMTAAASQAGWGEIEYTLYDAYSFTLKGGITENINTMSKDEGVEWAKAFLRDSGLKKLFADAGIEYEFEAASGDGPAVTFCYLLCDGSRTGAYIRFIFEDAYLLGECQAFIYDSEYIESLKKLSLEDALKQAFHVEGGKLVSINSADYTVANERIVYVNGLPYYRFDGYGVSVRGYIKGYALAVDLEDSPIRDELIKKHLSFNLN